MARYQCKCCGLEHDGITAFHADRPEYYWDVPEEKRAEDVFLTSDSCVIANRFFFVHTCLEIPIRNEDEPFVWGVWVSLKEENFLLWQDNYGVPQRSHVGPFFAWLSTRLPVYPDTLNLKTMVYMRDNGIRPFIELEQTNHPLAIDQREGITLERALEIVHELQQRPAESPL
jgi:hypothetical protein